MSHHIAHLLSRQPSSLKDIFKAQHMWWSRLHCPAACLACVPLVSMVSTVSGRQAGGPQGDIHTHHLSGHVDQWSSDMNMPLSSLPNTHISNYFIRNLKGVST